MIHRVDRFRRHPLFIPHDRGLSQKKSLSLESRTILGPKLHLINHLLYLPTAIIGLARTLYPS